MKRFLLVLITILFCGCSTYPVKMYDGPEKPTTELSIVRIWNPGVIVKSIDGKPGMTTGRESHAYVAPGSHEFVVAYISGATYSEPVTLQADTKPDHSYTFAFQLLGDNKVSFAVQDKGQNYDPNCLIPKPRATGGTKGKDC